MVGEAWQTLARELEDELRAGDPAVRVSPRIDAAGLLRLDVITTRSHRSAARAAARRYEARAADVCEHCGGTGTVRAGAVVTVLCPDCLAD